MAHFKSAVVHISTGHRTMLKTITLKVLALGTDRVEDSLRSHRREVGDWSLWHPVLGDHKDV
jgi:hypothetical protein